MAIARGPVSLGDQKIKASDTYSPPPFEVLEHLRTFFVARIDALEGVDAGLRSSLGSSMYLRRIVAPVLL